MFCKIDSQVLMDSDSSISGMLKSENEISRKKSSYSSKIKERQMSSKKFSAQNSSSKR